MERLSNVIVIMLCIITSSYAQTKKGFTIKGEIEGLKNGSVLYLTLASSPKDTVCKAISNGSSFTLKGSVEGEANYFFLRMDSAKNKTKVSNALWLINSDLTVLGKISDWKRLALSGSEPHDEYVKVMALEDSVQKLKEDEIAKALKGFINAHSNSLYVSHLILNASRFYEAKELISTYEGLTLRAKHSYWGVKLGDRVSGIKKSLKHAPGTITDFTITTVDGNKKSIYELASKSKYTLIDFWASWCAPCRAAMPKLKKVYDVFHSKGFNIIGVSSDKSASAWKKALEEDDTPWTHGIDNIDHATKNIFDLAGIPGYILIDKHGKIVKTEIFTSTSGSQTFFVKADESLTTGLYEIVETLLRDHKSK